MENDNKKIKELHKAIHEHCNALYGLIEKGLEEGALLSLKAPTVLQNIASLQLAAWMGFDRNETSTDIARLDF